MVIEVSSKAYVTGASLDEEAVDRMMEDIDRLDVTSLTAFIASAYQQAKAARQECGVEEEFEYCAATVKNEYTAAERTRLGIDDSNDIFAPITSTKVMALESWLRDIFVNAEEQPWTIEPTEIPDLPQWMEDRILQQVAQEFAAVGENADPMAVADRLSELKALALPEARRIAARAARRVEKFLADQMQEGGFREAFDGFIHDFSVFPNAFIKGPFISHKQKLVWENGTVVAKTVPTLTVAHVSPHNIFPSPNALTTQDGGYIIERMFMSASDLRELAELPDAASFGYDAAAIDELLEAFPNGTTGSSVRQAQLDFFTESTVDTDQLFEVIVYYGHIREKVLAEHRAGVNATHVGAASETRHVEVWWCNNHVLRVVELGEGRLRPIHSTSFRKRPGRFWGISLPLVLRQIQRGANACLRSLVTNMAYSSGPIFELDADRLDLEDDLDEITPWRIFTTTTTSLVSQVTAQPAIRMHTIDSHSRELLLVYDRFEKMADDASGIPAYVIGAPQVAGAGRTLGGLALLMGNAAKGIKRVVSNIDKHVIEPLVSAAYLQAAISVEDRSLLADAEVKARGASGLLQRELTQARAVEVLQLLTPYVQAGVVPQDTVTILLRDIVASLGFSPDDLIPDVQRGADIQSFLQQQGAVPTAPHPNAAPDVLAQLQGGGLSQAPQVQLDQRSQPPPNPANAERIPQP
jgi:hypothetical protein